MGTTLEEAEAILARNKIEKLPVVDDDGRLTGLITVKDIQEDQVPGRDQGRPGPAARAARRSASATDAIERAQALIDAGVDVLVVDTAHGHSHGVLEVVRKIKAHSTSRSSPGNIATGDGARRSSTPARTPSRSASGPGSICTTRIVAGVGVPQITAIYECGAGRSPGTASPVIADGGIRYSGDIAKAIARRRRRGHARQPARRRRRDARRGHPVRRASASRSTGAWARWAP